ncbi:mitochondrial import inner membrane translocase subunit TIM50 [Blastocystis sp. subtype 4]|uniref:mitochondrial import inner membrane translocase subunit TIM50 n=1 Tax=Blastocystis sp. subtype 4 TaxID=944170 RepID=UPI0007113023|nr:mitochondrial import inner membrane translocase subunit TIM50 [Blastocystis sp. subtype 4]KNB46265.1 mitochondrial import inner membrane translocase subunit TIM50 [Blastocystis sp. subtype 4]|eukprot:XP_014529713.1 mitochondrial import inner membrane translocase subunit TIM50 [Blastocystis sp. subtype 4]
MQRLTSVAKKTGELTSVCERALTRSFAEVPPKIPRKAPAAAIPRKSGSTQKVTTRMSNKYAYPIYTTAGTKSDHTFVQQMKLDYEAIRDKIVNYKKNFTEITANDLPVFTFDPARTGPDGKPIRTLFIDLEDTLITSEWDKVNGERHIKRPGVDKMLMYLSSMYEIYLVSNMDMTYGMEMVTQLDSHHVCSGYLFSDSMKLRNGSRVKDISYFSRDPKRVIVVDDNVNANEQPENVLVVKPFKNARRVKDTTLLDLIPILEEIYLEDVEDVRDYIAKLDKTDVVSSYRDLVRMRNENDR